MPSCDSKTRGEALNLIPPQAVGHPARYGSESKPSLNGVSPPPESVIASLDRASRVRLAMTSRGTFSTGPKRWGTGPSRSVL
jgi:hypothetical protein